MQHKPTPTWDQVRPSDFERFEAKVDRSPGHGPNGDCHIWTAGRSGRMGYGTFGLRHGYMFGAHVVAMFFETQEWPTGVWPDKRHVMHSCDNPPCVNPAHLSIGTARDNVLDMVAKGRHHYQQKRAA